MDYGRNARYLLAQRLYKKYQHKIHVYDRTNHVTKEMMQRNTAQLTKDIKCRNICARSLGSINREAKIVWRSDTVIQDDKGRKHSGKVLAGGNVTLD